MPATSGSSVGGVNYSGMAGHDRSTHSRSPYDGSRWLESLRHACLTTVPIKQVGYKSTTGNNMQYDYQIAEKIIMNTEQIYISPSKTLYNFYTKIWLLYLMDKITFACLVRQGLSLYTLRYDLPTKPSNNDLFQYF